MEPRHITLRVPSQLPEGIAWLRQAAIRAGVSPLARAGLVLAVADLVRAAHADGRPARVTVTAPPRRTAGSPPREDPHLTVSVSVADGYAPLPLAGLLPSPLVGDEVITWRVPADGRPCRTLPPDEEELRALASLAQRSADDLAALDAELAETNRGVVQLYAELEERDRRLRAAHRTIFRNLEDALRPPPPEVPGLEFGVVYRPAEAEAPTGGDLYDWVLLPDGDLQVAVVDVVGHGVESTRDALNVTHTLRILGLQGRALDTIVAAAGELLQAAFPGLMATLLVARITPETGRLRIAGGSHPPLVLAQPSSPAVLVHSPGLGIGYPDPGTLKVEEAVLRPGATALLYTDGLVEAALDINQGLDDLIASTDRHRDSPVPDLAKRVVDDLHQRILHTDDTLLLAVRWLGGSPFPLGDDDLGT